MVPLFGTDLGAADNWEAELQLNRYRIMLAELGLKINRMQLQVTVRDGGLYVAYQRGILRNIYKIPIPVMPDDDVKKYFKFKKDSLKEALADGWTIPCDDRESWDGMKCKYYCDVAQWCPKGRALKAVEGDE